MILENGRARKIRHSRSKLARYVSIIRSDNRFNWIFENSEETVEERAKRNYNNMRSCSCILCGNPRRYFNVQTLQEIRAEMFAKSQFDDFGVFWKGSRFRSKC